MNLRAISDDLRDRFRAYFARLVDRDGEIDRLERLLALERLSHEYDPADYMCPRCVTPWKCNGPHDPDCPTTSDYQ